MKPFGSEVRQETTCTFLCYLVSVYLDISAAVPSRHRGCSNMHVVTRSVLTPREQFLLSTPLSTFQIIYLARHTIKHRQLSLSGLGPWIWNWFHSFSVPLKHRADIIKFDPSLVRCLMSDDIIASYVVSIELQWVGQLICNCPSATVSGDGRALRQSAVNSLNFQPLPRHCFITTQVLMLSPFCQFSGRWQGKGCNHTV